VKSQLAVLENIAQKNLDLFKNGIFGADEKAAKLIAKVVAAREHILEAAKAHPVCADEELPQMLRPGEWPCKLEAPTTHITVSTPLDNDETPSFKPPEGFHQRMSALHDQIKLDLSDWRTSEKSKHIKSQERDVLKICKKHRSTNGGLSYYDKYENRFGIDELLICSDDVLFEFWNTCFEIYGDLLISYDINIIEKSKYDLMLYRLQGKAFEGIKQGHDFATHCLTYFDAIEIAPVMARVLGTMPAQTWLQRFSDTAISGLLVGAFSDVLNDRSIAQQTLRWLARQGFRDKIELKAKSYGEEAHAFAMKFLDRSSDADFLPKKLPKLPAYFVASAHPAPVLKSSGKSLPPHAVDTFARMLLASTCYLPTPALLNVIKVCDAQSLADFAMSAYDGWVKNGSKKDGIGFLHALGYIGDARAAPLIIKAYKNEPFYPATAAAIEVLGAIGSNTSISGLLSIMRFSRYDKAQAYAQEALEAVADARGLTTEQLEDLAIPDLGLNSGGEMHLNFGARQFTASITAELDVVLTDGSGRVIKALPKATNEDDARLAKLATVQWKEFNSARKGVSKGQLQRFEQAMAQTRRWDIGTFKDVIAVHPLLVKMVRNLVWAEASDDLKQINPFRIDATGRFVDVNDEVLRLPDNASIILPHPLLLNIEIPLWQDVFAREKLTQPVLQLARKWFVQGTQTDALIDEKSENQVPLGVLKGLKSKGWEFDEIGAGMVWRVSKSVDGAWASMDVDPGWSLSGHDGDGSTGSQTVKLSMSSSNPIAYSELVREFLSLPIVTNK
jgi:hypothetical protein